MMHQQSMLAGGVRVEILLGSTPSTLFGVGWYEFGVVISPIASPELVRALLALKELSKPWTSRPSVFSSSHRVRYIGSFSFCGRLPWIRENSSVRPRYLFSHLQRQYRYLEDSSCFSNFLTRLAREDEGLGCISSAGLPEHFSPF